MELKEIMLKRRSTRKFTAEKVKEEEIEELLHAAMSGPSAVNRTPWEFYVVENEEKLKELRKATLYTNYIAPLAIVVCGNLSRALPFELKDYWIHDCSAASENILLRAVDLGLAAVWCGVYPQKKGVDNVRRILGLPDKHVPLNIIYLGHGIEDKEPRDQYAQKYIHYVR